MHKVMDTLPIGTILRGKSYSYQILEKLGQGSFGITYLASVKMAGALGAIDANIKVAIKEFFMRDINGRSDATVTSGSKGGIYDDKWDITGIAAGTMSVGLSYTAGGVALGAGKGALMGGLMSRQNSKNSAVRGFVSEEEIQKVLNWHKNADFKLENVSYKLITKYF